MKSWLKLSFLKGEKQHKELWPPPCRNKAKDFKWNIVHLREPTAIKRKARPGGIELLVVGWNSLHFKMTCKCHFVASCAFSQTYWIGSIGGGELGIISKVALQIDFKQYFVFSRI